MKQFSLKNTIVLTALLFSSIANGSDWKLVVDAGYLIYEVDQETIFKEKSAVAFWSRTTVQNSEGYFGRISPNEIPYAIQKEHHRMDCSKRTHTILAGTKYNDVGQPVSSFDESLPEVSIVPDSVAEYYFRVVCGRSVKKR